MATSTSTTVMPIHVPMAPPTAAQPARPAEHEGGHIVVDDPDVFVAGRRHAVDLRRRPEALVRLHEGDNVPARPWSAGDSS